MELGTKQRPLRVAIIGSGPSGFYAVASLLKLDIEVEVRVFEQLASPFGLVRSGVAPDHAKIKSVIKSYEKLAEDPRVELCCNVEIGKDISIEELQTYFDALVFCHGASQDRALSIPGEDLLGSHTATEFVGWYNAHPHFLNRSFDLSAKRVTVIGQGNVAVDVTRILAKSNDELKNTDIANYALEALSNSKVEEISMLGRRGPLQAAFTEKEVRELGELRDCDVHVAQKDLELSQTDTQELESAKGRVPKNFQILSDFAKRDARADCSKRINIRFFRSPVELLGDGRLEAIRLEINELYGEPGAQRARGTGVFEEVPCDLVFRSIGYRGHPLQGLPFDETRGVVPNDRGRVLLPNEQTPGLYVSGWIKRGPSGIIGTNKPDSVETIKMLEEDLPSLPSASEPSDEALRDLLTSRGVRVISYEDWKRIDAAEAERGALLGKPREKFTSIEEALAALD